MSGYHCLFIAHILTAPHANYNLRISGTIVRFENDALYLGTLVEVIGSVKTSSQTQHKWVECRGFSVNEDPIYETLHALRTIHLQQQHPWIDRLSTPKPTPAPSATTQRMLQSDAQWKPDLSFNHQLDRARAAAARRTAAARLSQDDSALAHPIDRSPTFQTGLSFDDDLDLDEMDLDASIEEIFANTGHQNDAVTDAVEALIHSEPSGITFADLDAIFARNNTAKGGTLESVLRKLIMAGAVYEKNGRYLAL
ncbi:hypothetical protein BC936DRAFT_147902 [Jimgerdemannia flammicorona]|uniref:Uncharacterized protein n=1 Tax=Jimgerdemannia flammicorona TaxID=994334 RepID=A0A433D488_9FUNG|nr:hypothetical protein BC936DRAFT_147902 [Jimgerdemannia flammicorona]